MGSVQVLGETDSARYRNWPGDQLHRVEQSSNTQSSLSDPSLPSSMAQRPSSRSSHTSPATSVASTSVYSNQGVSTPSSGDGRLNMRASSRNIPQEGDSSSATSGLESREGTGNLALPHHPDDPDSKHPIVGPKIKVRDLQHIQSFDDNALDRMASSQTPSRGADDEYADVPPQYEISEMPVSDVIEMVAGLLTKITTTNDAQHEHLHRQIPTAESAIGMTQQTASVLAFHGKNVPNITIMSYLTRIHKYCPATFEVFLSLLVYFDRMTDKVNAGPLQNLRQSTERMEEVASERASDYGEKEQSHSSGLPSPPLSDSDPCNLQHFFVVDSYNIHRLVIAGVTCASKFFSDIFYTNSRYAKVGGLPLTELNHLELQFLLLNDFRLSIRTEELEAYATMLVEFYAREIVAQRRDEASAAQASTE